MSSLRYGVRCLRALPTSTTKQWLSLASSICTQSTRPASGRLFTTTSRQQDEQLSALLKAASSDDSGQAVILPHVRAVPLSPSYFARHHHFYDSYVRVQELLHKYARLPTVSKGNIPPVVWRTKAQYRLAVGEDVKGRDFEACFAVVKRLHRIHPDLMPEEVMEGIRPFMRVINSHGNNPKTLPIDKFGRSHGVGRRKSSTARAWLVEGTGEVLVNGKPLSEAFGRVHDRESSIWGLKAAERLDKYNVWALVSGGGTTGQAEALAMAIAKALVVQEPPLKMILRKAGCITRDPRSVERKKTGHVKARKSPAWVKR